MTPNRSKCSAWLSTVNRLCEIAAQPHGGLQRNSRNRHTRVNNRLEAETMIGMGTITVRIVDRCSLTTAFVEWCDPTKCRYGSQLWRASKSKRVGICALTGAAVKVGDAIYKPSSGVNVPNNSSAMIRAEFIEALPCDEDA